MSRYIEFMKLKREKKMKKNKNKNSLIKCKRCGYLIFVLRNKKYKKDS